MCSSSTASRPGPLAQAALALLLLLAGLLGPAGPALAAPALREPGTAVETPAPAPGVLAVIYPDLGEPYRGIFNTILKGIEARARLPVQRYPVSSTLETAGLEAQLRRNGVGAVIALGRQGVLVATALDTDLPIVAGAVLTLPGASRPLPGISLTPDPGLLFSHLKRLLPDTRRVTVIYNPQQSGWLIRLAQAAAQRQGLELQALPARDLAAAVRLYKDVFAAAAGQDALWLPHDTTTVDEDVILPLVLREAWARDIAVVSSSLLHVRKGALLGLYPDNAALGQALADLALDSMASAAPAAGLVPLQTVLTAINLRTASHLGVNLAPAQQRRFDFVFPEP